MLSKRTDLAEKAGADNLRREDFEKFDSPQRAHRR